MGSRIHEKPRILCLHGCRRSAEILKKQILKWPAAVLEKLDLDFLDAPYPAQGKSYVEEIFDPPYYEWYQFDQDRDELKNFEECVEYIEDYMVKNGPFDGFLGFSQGALLSAAFPGIQSCGMALTKVPKIKFVIIISGSKYGGLKTAHNKLLETAYLSPVECPSLHIIGETDYMKMESIAFMEAFVDPVVIYHPQGHTIPELDEKSTEVMLGFIERIQKAMAINEEDFSSSGQQFEL